MSTFTSFAKGWKTEVGVAPPPGKVQSDITMTLPLHPREEECEAMSSFFSLSVKEDSCVLQVTLLILHMDILLSSSKEDKS